MDSPTTVPQPRSAPMCEQCAAMTTTFPRCVRKPTSCRPRIRLAYGFSKSSERQNRYHEAGYAGKRLIGGGAVGIPGLTDSGFLLRLFMSKLNVSGTALTHACLPDSGRVKREWQVFCG